MQRLNISIYRALSLVAITLFVALFLQGCKAENQADGDGAVYQKLSIHSEHSDVEHIFDVEIARTLAEQEKGLMYRESLARDKGMIFIYAAPRFVGFWMKNTLIPLDIIFIAENGKILNIHKMAKPHDLTPIKSIAPVTKVLEIRGGLVDELDIQVGDIVKLENNQ